MRFKKVKIRQPKGLNIVSRKKAPKPLKRTIKYVTK